MLAEVNELLESNLAGSIIDEYLPNMYVGLTSIV